MDVRHEQYHAKGGRSARHAQPPRSACCTNLVHVSGQAARERLYGCGIESPRYTPVRVEPHVFTGLTAGPGYPPQYRGRFLSGGQRCRGPNSGPTGASRTACPATTAQPPSTSWFPTPPPVRTPTRTPLGCSVINPTSPRAASTGQPGPSARRSWRTASGHQVHRVRPIRWDVWDVTRGQDGPKYR